MPFLRRGTNPSRAKRGENPIASPPARSDIGENSASELIESPRKHRDPLDAHDFADGGGGGGAANFSREKTKDSAKDSSKDPSTRPSKPGGSKSGVR